MSIENVKVHCFIRQDPDPGFFEDWIRIRFFPGGWVRIRSWFRFFSRISIQIWVFFSRNLDPDPGKPNPDP